MTQLPDPDSPEFCAQQAERALKALERRPLMGVAGVMAELTLVAYSVVDVPEGKSRLSLAIKAAQEVLCENEEPPPLPLINTGANAARLALIRARGVLNREARWALQRAKPRKPALVA